MTEERAADRSALATLLRCCQPGRLAGVGGILIAAAMLLGYLVWGRPYLATHQEASGAAGQTLLQIVDVFKCCILTWKALTVMLPTFVLAAAITVFVPTPVVLRLLGDQAHKVTAYFTAAFSGIVLSLCSCNVVPLFVSIRRRGAGVGPAFAFLFAGPAINVVAAIFTFQVIGLNLGIWRLVGVPFIAIAVGLMMARLFRDEALPTAAGTVQYATPADGMRRVGGLIFLLFAMVLYGSWGRLWRSPGEGAVEVPTWWMLGMAPLVGLFALLLARGFTRDETRSLGRETWHVVKMVVPILLPAVLVIGAVSAFIDVKLVYRLVGTVAEDAGFWGQLRPIAIGAVFGDLMYFPILSEVAFTKAFLKLGMGVGPALAILLLGPGTSLPGVILIARAIGWKRAVVYEALSILVTIVYVAVFVGEIGQYICACLNK